MKKIALFAIVCCAMIFSSCNRDQHTYYTTTTYEFANHDNEVSTKAVLGTINLYWNGDYAFTGNDQSYTDLRAEAKYLEAVAAIIVHGDEIKVHMADGDKFNYRLYRKSDNVLLDDTQFYLDENGAFASEYIVDNVEGN